MSAEVIALADRRPPPAVAPFAETAQVVRFDLGRRPVPAPWPTHEERIALLEEEVRRLRETNAELLEVLCVLLVEVRGRRLTKANAGLMGLTNADA